ncbi:MAG TPA: trehalose-6-phosphate synthase [Actinomycetota bacterium]|nr:trehalose-6-phosphate synthase [Actinomycetota bacterium]
MSERSIEQASLVFVSNRGPIQFDDDGVPHRGAGGLVTVLSSALIERQSAWVAAAMSKGDRLRTGLLSPEQTGLDDVWVRMLDIPAKDYDPYYNRLSNRVLWFVNHYLFDPPRTPIFDEDDMASWDAYVAVNRRFAEAVADTAPEGASVFVQDYHLALAPATIRDLRPDLKIALFWHIPFAQPDYLRMLPDEWSRALLDGMLSADLAGFQTSRWADAFRWGCKDLLGARTGEKWVKHAGNRTRIGVYPVGINGKHLLAAAASPDVGAERKALADWAGGRRFILRVDRTELSKNILRGMLAFEALLDRRPDLRGRVAHMALMAPSRGNVPEYAEYTEQCVAAADRINKRYGADTVRVDIENAIDRAYAAYGLYDVLVVNPVFDGMNLVAFEGPILNRRDGQLVLSQNAGAYTRLAPAAYGVNPFSIQATAAAIGAAIDAPADERRERAKRLRRLARSHRPARWLLAQIRDVQRAAEERQG